MEHSSFNLILAVVLTVS